MPIESLEQLKNLGKYYKKEPRQLRVKLNDGSYIPVQEVLANIPPIVIVAEEKYTEFLAETDYE